jgi:hypothetical protein
MGEKPLSEQKKFSELVLEERKKGNVVYLALDAILSAPVKEIIKQPTDGLLWDLNRDEVTALSFMDEEGMIHWVNNFAVALVIKELKSQLTQIESQIDAMRDFMALLYLGIREGRDEAFEALDDKTKHLINEVWFERLEEDD